MLRDRVSQPSFESLSCRQYFLNEYVTIAVESQFKQLRSSRKKGFSGLQQDLNPWPLRSRCSALPAEL